MKEAEKKKVEQLFSRVMEVEGISWEQARRRAHLYVCGGGCNWFKEKADRAGFDPSSLTPRNRAGIAEIIKAAFPDRSEKEASKLIHQYICG